MAKNSAPNIVRALTSTSFLSRRDLNLWRSAVKGLGNCTRWGLPFGIDYRILPTYARVHALDKRVRSWRIGATCEPPDRGTGRAFTRADTRALTGTDTPGTGHVTKAKKTGERL